MKSYRASRKNISLFEYGSLIAQVKKLKEQKAQLSKAKLEQEREIMLWKAKYAEKQREMDAMKVKMAIFETKVSTYESVMLFNKEREPSAGDDSINFKN